MKRAFDVVAAAIGLLFASPILFPVMILVWMQDGNSPFYIAERVGKDEQLFNMIKLRSMITNADKSGVDSTGSDDQRITPIGHFIRRYKLDELTQLWNVLKGEMSLVGPRPNVKRETDLYTQKEKLLLKVKPGITDFASIVFSDEGEVLRNEPDPDIAYNQLIRPGKGQLGLYYIETQSLALDLKLCFATALAIVSRDRALLYLQRILKLLGADQGVIELASRTVPLSPSPPPGATKIVLSRDSSFKS